MSQPVADALQLAERFFRSRLKASPDAIEYLKGRGVRGEIAARFRLGFAPGGSQGLRTVFPDYADPSLVECGLVIAAEGGRRYDRFRDRIMFPILDETGAVVGFGGRVLAGAGPKYLNSPETPTFQKGTILFGLPQAAAAIAATSTVHVVEGYLDVVSLAQHGIENSVATLGTATTARHVTRLLSIAKRVVFCFDGDDAGRQAASRALAACRPHVDDATTIEFLFLPRGHDPDSYVRQHGAEAFQALAVEAATFEGFFLADAMHGVSLEHAEGRAQLVARAAPGLREIHAPVLLRRMLNELAQHTRFSVADLIALCQLMPASSESMEGEKYLCIPIDGQ